MPGHLPRSPPSATGPSPRLALCRVVRSEATGPEIIIPARVIPLRPETRTVFEPTFSGLHDGPRRYQLRFHLLRRDRDRLPEERAAFIARACGTDEELRRRVERLVERPLSGGELP